LWQRSQKLAAEEDDSLFYEDLTIRTNGTIFECCQLDWLYVEGRKFGDDIKDMVQKVVYFNNLFTFLFSFSI